jgi:hypothetical protein
MTDSTTVACTKRKDQHTARVVSQLRQEVTITHPFHPRYSEKFHLLSYGRPRGIIETVVLLDDNDTTISVPLSWTDAGETDAFAALSSGRSWFRASDLARLTTIVEQLPGRMEAGKEV